MPHAADLRQTDYRLRSNGFRPDPTGLLSSTHHAIDTTPAKVFFEYPVWSMSVDNVRQNSAAGAEFFRDHDLVIFLFRLPDAGFAVSGSSAKSSRIVSAERPVPVLLSLQWAKSAQRPFPDAR